MFENGCFLRRQKRFKLLNKEKPERPRRSGPRSVNNNKISAAERKANLLQQKQLKQQHLMIASASPILEQKPKRVKYNLKIINIFWEHVSIQRA